MNSIKCTFTYIYFLFINNVKQFANSQTKVQDLLCTLLIKPPMHVSGRQRSMLHVVSCSIPTPLTNAVLAN